MAVDVKVSDKEITVKRAARASGLFVASVLVSIATAALTSMVFINSATPNVVLNEANKEVSSEAQQTVVDDLESKDRNLYENAIVGVVDTASKSVVSVVATKDLPIIEKYYTDPFGGGFNSPFRIPRYRQNGTEEREVSGGTGFVVSEDGNIVTNRHVVDIEDAAFTVIFSDGERYDAEVLAMDSIEDLAVLKIDMDNAPALTLGDSDVLNIGQTAIAIGNALGQFQNTVSVGVVSGLDRSIVAGSGKSSEKISGAIQTDAAINFGNSGGPLLNISGEVIGINTAIASGSENIGFAIPVNKVKKVVNDVEEFGKISRPFIGVRFVDVDKDIKEARGLEFDYGALIAGSGDGLEPGVSPGYPAYDAGIREGDVILEVNSTRVDEKNSLGELIARYSVGDTITLKVWNSDGTRDVSIVLVERPQ